MLARLIVVVAFLSSFTAPLAVAADVWVNGYFKKNGTYVEGHYRSSPDGDPTNNWSYPGNTNPYTGETATGDPATYLQNHGSGGSSYSIPTYTPSSTYVPSSYGIDTSANRVPITGGYKLYGVVFCEANYYETSGGCAPLPANARSTYLGFDCKTGFYRDNDQCIALPANSRANYPTGYSCNYGYYQQGSSCLAGADYCRVTSAGLFDATYGRCYCSAGQFKDATGTCATVESICKQSFGGFAIEADNQKCTCMSGSQWNADQTKCLPPASFQTAAVSSPENDKMIQELKAQIAALLAIISELQAKGAKARAR